MVITVRVLETEQERETQDSQGRKNRRIENDVNNAPHTPVFFRIIRSVFFFLVRISALYVFYHEERLMNFRCVRSNHVAG